MILRFFFYNLGCVLSLRCDVSVSLCAHMHMYAKVRYPDFLLKEKRGKWGGGNPTCGFADGKNPPKSKTARSTTA